MQKLTIKTHKKKEVLDITDTVEKALGRRNSSDSGICNLFILHTTAALTTADLDPGTDLDLLDALDKLLPDINYRHPHNPSHTPDHILSSIIGPSIVIPVKNEKLILGNWQRVILIEFD